MPTDFLLLAVNPMISAVSGLAGVCLGGWLAQRNQRIERRQRRIREQLEQFYAPMLGYRQRLRARGELRVKFTRPPTPNGRALSGRRANWAWKR